MAGRLTHVSVQKGVGHNLLAAAEFARLPLTERIELVLQGRAVFLDDEGKTMPAEVAIGQLATIKK